MTTLDDIIIGQWIDKNVSLPKFNEMVILKTTGGVTVGYLERIDAYGQHWVMCDPNKIYWEGKGILYWMTLPE